MLSSKQFVLLSAYCLLLTAGCAHVPLDARYPGPKLLPLEVAAYYAYPTATPTAHVELLEERPRFSRFLVRFPLHVVDFEPTEPVIELEWFESKAKGARPAILFSPILGGDYPLERGICQFFASHGFHVALVHRKTLKVAPEKDASYLELLLRQAIVRNRQVVDWMASQRTVDPQQLGGFGISMGGMATCITAALEPRLRCHVVALAGGPLADILRDSRDSLLTKPRIRYLSHHQIDLATMHRMLNEQLKTDPIRLAPYIDARKLLMFIALFDRTVGRANAFRLWRALGRPEVLFIPLGHYTSYLYLPVLKRASLRFFQKHLENR